MSALVRDVSRWLGRASEVPWCGVPAADPDWLGRASGVVNARRIPLARASQ